MPESISKDMDVGVMFEGEETIAELIQLYDKAGKFNAENLSPIKGICY
ncbi:hypothetical protein ES703_19154 [subsurface metagenome]